MWGRQCYYCPHLGMETLSPERLRELPKVISQYLVETRFELKAA